MLIPALPPAGAAAPPPELRELPYIPGLWWRTGFAAMLSAHGLAFLVVSVTLFFVPNPPLLLAVAGLALSSLTLAVGVRLGRATWLKPSRAILNMDTGEVTLRAAAGRLKAPATPTLFIRGFRHVSYGPTLTLDGVSYEVRLASGRPGGKAASLARMATGKEAAAVCAEIASRFGLENRGCARLP